MTQAGKRSSRWIADFEKQLLRQKHVILYGNVHDQLLWRGAYQSANEFLRGFFRDQGFEVILQYDPVDGLSFADETARETAEPAGLSGMRTQYRRLVREGITARNLALADAPDVLVSPPVAVDPAQPPPRGLPGQVLGMGRPGPASRPKPEDAFGDLRMALTQRTIAVAAVVDLGDLLTTDPERYSADERLGVALLKKCTLEASVLTCGVLIGYRNTVVLLAGDLGRVPEWFYRDNPLVAIVQVERPDKDERRQFAIQFVPPWAGGEGFLGGNRISSSPIGPANAQIPAPPSELEQVAEEFADLTEGMQAIDLNALRMTSHAARIPVRVNEIRRLVDYFKFGLREDPWENLNAARVRDAARTLSEKVIGQPRAVEAVVTMLTSGKVGLSMAGGGIGGGRPKGVFFFVGPTGVGKTELAKAVTELVFGDPRAFARFDMSEYKEEHAAEKLAGAPPGFVGYDEGGQLTNRVMRQPHSILLFDEIEKAHPKVLDKFLQILEDGRLTDGKGQTAYFNQCAIIFTSNIGASDLTDPQSGALLRPGIMKNVKDEGAASFPYEAVATHFRAEVDFFFTSRIGRAEILNRLGDNIVVFDLLRPEYVAPIGRKFLGQLSAAASEKYQLRLTFEGSILEGLAADIQTGDNVLYGGRRIKSLLETRVERPLNRWIFEHVPDMTQLAGRTLSIGLAPGGCLEVSDV